MAEAVELVRIVRVRLSKRERLQLIESLDRWWTSRGTQLSPVYRSVVASADAKLRKGMWHPFRVLRVFTKNEAKVLVESLQYQRSLVKYKNEKSPGPGKFGPVVYRKGPAERIHIAPLWRKFAKAAGEIDETSNPELGRDPKYQ